MDEDTQEIINVPLTIWEVRNIRYYLYNTINKDNMYTSNYMDFLKNLFKKFDIVLAELEQPNTIRYLSEVDQKPIGTVGQVFNVNTLKWED